MFLKTNKYFGFCAPKLLLYFLNYEVSYNNEGYW